MKNLKICSIDPGVTGAIALIDQDGYFLKLKDMPTYKTGIKNQKEIDPIKLIDIFKEMDPDYFILEKIHAMPKQGVTSTMNFGINFGIIKGAIAACNKEPILVSPQKWKNHFKLSGKPKVDALYNAQNMFPEAPLSLKKHVDRADALHIGVWFQQVELTKKEKSV